MDLVDRITKYINYFHPLMDYEFVNNRSEIVIRAKPYCSREFRKHVLRIKLRYNKKYKHQLRWKNGAYICYSTKLFRIKHTINDFVCDIVFPDSDNEEEECEFLEDSLADSFADEEVRYNYQKCYDEMWPHKVNVNISVKKT